MKKITLIQIRAGLYGFFVPFKDLYKSIPSNSLTFILFLFIPVFYIAASSIAYNARAPYYLFSIDPEYFYMYNGVILGAGNLSIQYYAHPGTPLHFLVAISTRITDLFQQGSYMENFVNDPEMFIRSANLFINIIIAIILFIAARFTLKYTGSVWAALAVQLSPFASFSLPEMAGRVYPEALMMAPLLLIIVMVIKNTFEPEKQHNLQKDLILYALITGFGAAVKLTFAPLLLLPLLLLKTSFREKLRYIAYSVLFFLIFAYPLLFNIGDSWDWITGIMVHSGKYGTGERNFIDLSAAGMNARDLLVMNSGFFYLLIASLLIIMVLSLNPVKKRLLPDRRIIRAILAIDLVVIACMAPILKHYSLYYFLPFTIFKFPVFLLLTALLLRIKVVAETRPFRLIIVLLAFVYFVFTLAVQVGQFRTHAAINTAKHAKTIENARKLVSSIDPGKPIIITSPYYGSPFIEFAHYNGYIMSRHLKGFYTDYLRKKFPNCYMSPTWSENFYSWDNFVDFKDILATVKSSFYIYIGCGMEKDLPVIKSRISQVLDMNSVMARTLYDDPDTGEQLIEIIVNQ